MRTMKTRSLRAGVGALALAVGVAACGGTGASEPPTVTVPSGTELVAHLNEELSTRTHQAGDAFSATLASAVSVGDTAAIPAGAVVHGTVTGAQQADDSGRKGVLKLDVDAIEMRGSRHPVTAEVVSAQPEMRSSSSTGEDAAKVGGAAAAGAVLGRIIGGDGTGAAVGAAVGAAAGTGIVLATEDGYAVLPQGSDLRLRLTEPVTVPVSGGEADASESSTKEGGS